MKQIIITISILLTLIITVKSQDYVPFPTENAQWNVYLEKSISESPIDTIIMRYVLNGDTTINQVKYNRLCLENDNTETTSITPIGGIREEEKKIYFVGFDFLGFVQHDELLLYDFNVQVGDTVFHTDGFSIIEAIDSVEVNGEYRNRYKISPDSRNSNYSFQDEYWVEGIGSIKNGLLGHITIVPTCCYSFWEHICFKEDGDVIYLNPTFSDCAASNFFVGVNHYSTSSQVKVYPNPANGQTIYFEGLGFETLELYDNVGNTVLIKDICGLEKCTLDISGLTSGVYFYQLNSEGEAPAIGKLIIP